MYQLRFSGNLLFGLHSKLCLVRCVLDKVVFKSGTQGQDTSGDADEESVLS